MTEYLRMSGMYWGLTAMDIMGSLQNMDRQQVIIFLRQCVDESGGVSPSIGHDPHLLYTLSAVQVCLIAVSYTHLLASFALNELCLPVTCHHLAVAQ